MPRRKKSWIKAADGSVWDSTGNPSKREFYRDTVMQHNFQEEFGDRLRFVPQIDLYTNKIDVLCCWDNEYYITYAVGVAEGSIYYIYEENKGNTCDTSWTLPDLSTWSSIKAATCDVVSNIVSVAAVKEDGTVLVSDTFKNNHNTAGIEDLTGVNNLLIDVANEIYYVHFDDETEYIYESGKDPVKCKEEVYGIARPLNTSCNDSTRVYKDRTAEYYIGSLSGTITDKEIEFVLSAPVAYMDSYVVISVGTKGTARIEEASGSGALEANDFTVDVSTLYNTGTDLYCDVYGINTDGNLIGLYGDYSQSNIDDFNNNTLGDDELVDIGEGGDQSYVIYSIGKSGTMYRIAGPTGPSY